MMMEVSEDTHTRTQTPAFTGILTRFAAESMGQSYFSNQLSFPLSTSRTKHIITEKQQFALVCARKRACVSDDVIEDDKPLELQLELPVGVFRQRLSFKPPEPEICILVSVNKQLERTDLDGRQSGRTFCQIPDEVFSLQRHRKHDAL